MRPTTQTLSHKIESIQKRAIKWILSEENLSYTCFLTYVSKCKLVNLLPLSVRFELNDILFLHKVINKLVPVELPAYLSFFQGQSRLRSSHLDSLSLVSSISPRSSANVFANSFYYSTHCKWNRLPFEMREIESHQNFKDVLIKHMWKDLCKCDTDLFLEDEYDLQLENG